MESARGGSGGLRAWRFPNIRGTNFGDPHSKDYNILGSILGFPLFWESTM